MRFLIAVYRSSDYDPSTEDAAMREAIDVLNEAMVQAGARVFVGGLRSPEESTTVRWSGDQPVAVAPGLATDAGLALGGLWVLEVQDESEAVAWGRRAAEACRATVEVRPFH